MRKLYWLIALLLAALPGAFAQNSPQMTSEAPSPSDGNSPYANRLAGTVDVTVEKRIEMKKLKAGDPVEAKLKHDVKVDGKVVVTKNSRFRGHVAEVMSREHGDPVSRLAILFDWAATKNGDLPIYGAIAGVIVPRGDTVDELTSLQDTRLRRARTEALSGTASGETIDTIRELYQTSISGQPTAASKQFNCQQILGGLWCAPAGHTLLSSPVPVPGMPNVLFEAEGTPDGPLGVLVSGNKTININGGIDLVVRLLPRSRN